MPKKLKVIITCEHGGNQVPAQYKHLFRGHTSVLKTHRGYDIGALELSKRFARTVKTTINYALISRLVVELNRSIGNPKLFSEFTRSLSREDRQILLHDYYHPHRSRIEKRIANLNSKGKCVIHLGVHTFTPQLNGTVRKAEVGLLYNPSRRREVEFCKTWQGGLKDLFPSWRIRRNYPYKGINDGFLPYLRTRFKPSQYLGIEIEVNQKFAQAGGTQWNSIQRSIADSFAQTLESI